MAARFVASRPPAALNTTTSGRLTSANVARHFSRRLVYGHSRCKYPHPPSEVARAALLATLIRGRSTRADEVPNQMWKRDRLQQLNWRIKCPHEANGQFDRHPFHANPNRRSFPDDLNICGYILSHTIGDDATVGANEAIIRLASSSAFKTIASPFVNST